MTILPASAHHIRALQTTQCVNPVLAATRAVFESMLGCAPRRVDLSFRPDLRPEYEISGVIGVSGRGSGTIVLNLSRQTAERIYERMTETDLSLSAPHERDDQLCDAVGELVNMIGGGAKARLEGLSLSLSIPSVVLGQGHSLRFPSDVQPMTLEFESEIGPFAVDFGFCLP